MSQESLLGSVWASNYGTDGKPDGVGEVWIANASAITGGSGTFTGVNVSTSLTGDGKDIPLGINSPIVQQNNETTASFNQYGISINDGQNMEFMGVNEIRRWNQCYPMSVVATSSEATASNVVYVVTGSNP